MAVYGRDDPAHLAQAVGSIYGQTLSPSEVVIVIDGPIRPELEAAIRGLPQDPPTKIVRIAVNSGLGPALSRGLLHCEHELVARMDADDICVPNRLEIQALQFSSDPGLDILGGSVSEFEVSPDRPSAIRRSPLTHKDIVFWGRLRCPFNHPTVMYKKSAVLRAGGYSSSFRGIEDYELWGRLILSGARCGNVDDVLVHARIGGGMLNRRRGAFYARQELRLACHLFKIGFLSTWQFLVWVLGRVPLRLLPPGILSRVYRLMRTKSP